MTKKPNILKSYTKNEINSINRLNEVAKSFHDNFIFEMIFEKFLSKSLPSNINLIDKMKSLSKLEGNSVSIPTDEIVDLINFSIFMESEVKLDEINGAKEYKISKFSEIGEYLTEEEIVSDESTYTYNEVFNFILETTKSYTNNIKILDKNILIFF